MFTLRWATVSLLVALSLACLGVRQSPAGEQDSVEERLSAIEAELTALKAVPPESIHDQPKPSASQTQESTPTQTTFPSVSVNGVFQADAGWFNQDDVSLLQFGRLQDGADFRRARLSAKGAVAENMNYFVQMDFGFFGRPTFTDLWLDVTQLPLLGNVRVGQWKQPFSLEVVSSFRYTTLMERSLLFQPFTPFRHLGIGFYDHSEDLSTTWAASIFRSGQDQYGGSISTDGGNGLAGRITHLPWYDEPSGGRYYTHLGAGYFFNSPPRDAIRFRTIPELFIGDVAPGLVGTSGQPVPGAQNGTPFFVDTGALNSNQVHILGGELLLVSGPFSLQGEAMVALVDQVGNSAVALPGAYAQVGYFLTGEHRPYDRKLGAIERVQPFESFFWIRAPHGLCHGKGAWEVVARGSWIDLDDENVQGGQLTNTTLGVNWYLNPYCKVAANWVHAVLERPPDNSNTNLFAIRAQLDF